MSEWIKITDKTPPTYLLVLCCGAKGGLFLGSATASYVYDDSMYMSVPNARGGRHAVYWMPLPEAPKETAQWTNCPS